MILYLIKLNLSITLLFLVYHFLVKKERNFRFNRLYLLGGVAISILAPFLSFLPIGQNAEVLTYSLPAINVVADSLSGTQQNGFDFQFILILYSFLSAVFAFFFFMGIFRVIAILKKADLQIIENRRILVVPFPNTHFTFLNKIVISSDTPEEALPHILQHEATHQKELHTLDLLLIELLKVFFWYNPFIWLYKRAMVENHEFLADQSAASKKQKQISRIAFKWGTTRHISCISKPIF